MKNFDRIGLDALEFFEKCLNSWPVAEDCDSL